MKIYMYNYIGHIDRNVRNVFNSIDKNVYVILYVYFIYEYTFCMFPFLGLFAYLYIFYCMGIQRQFVNLFNATKNTFVFMSIQFTIC